MAGRLTSSGVGSTVHLPLPALVDEPVAPPAMINDYIEVNPRKLGGTPVFRETRIPVYVLFDYLEEGHTVEDFLAEYDIDPVLVHGFMRAVRDTFVTEEEAEV